MASYNLHSYSLVFTPNKITVYSSLLTAVAATEVRRFSIFEPIEISKMASQSRVVKTPKTPAVAYPKTHTRPKRMY